MGMIPRPMEIICFHCQQAAEKNLKGFLVEHGIKPMRTHDLMVLLNDCQALDASYQGIVSECELLTGYGTVSRYPDAEEILESDMKQALRSAQVVRQLVASNSTVFSQEHEIDFHEPTW